MVLSVSGCACVSVRLSCCVIACYEAPFVIVPSFPVLCVVIIQCIDFSGITGFTSTAMAYVSVKLGCVHVNRGNAPIALLTH